MEKPDVPQKAPFVMEVEPGNYAWCSCGKSTNQPYCDGAHKGSSFSPIIEVVEEKKVVAWCGCKNSSKGGFCDGSHSQL